MQNIDLLSNVLGTGLMLSVVVMILLGYFLTKLNHIKNHERAILSQKYDKAIRKLLEEIDNKKD